MSVNPATVQAIRIALDEWRREASGSAAQAEWYAEQAAWLRNAEQAAWLRNGEWMLTAEEYEQRAAEHRDDAERAERQVAELEQALRDAGLEP